MTENPKQGKKAKIKIKSWYSNRYQIVVVQRNVLLLFTLISTLSVAVAVMFVKDIMSSKSLEPYVIEVEQKTGIATVVDQMTSQTFTGDQMVRKYFINQFVHAASNYDPKTYKIDAEKVRLFSSANVYSEFRARINTKELGADSLIEVRIKSVQFPDANTAQIRFTKQVTMLYNPVKNVEEIATMKFYFVPDVSLTMEERFINPLGFQVSSYLVTEEAFSY